MKKIKITSRSQAQSRAMDWQHWQAEQVMFQSEVVEWQNYWEEVAKKFNLVEEFRENGII